MASVSMNDGGGLERLSVQLQLSGKESPTMAQKAVRKSTLEVERGGKTRAPVDTGNLRNSITSEFAGDARAGTFVGETGPEAYYGIFLEAGTERMAPRPFMGPAFDAVEPSFLAAIDEIARRG
jgi:HK97 gp10 family phage protein